MEKTSLIFRIPCYMFGPDGKLRPAAFLDIAQELAAIGSEQLHFSDREIAAHNIVWILARMSVNYVRLPHRGENVTIQTWSRGCKGPLFIRDYRMIDSGGNPIINSTSSWVIMNTQSRRLEKIESLPGIIDPEPQCTEAAMESASPRIFPPKNTEWSDVGRHKIMYSDTDYNGHANNARYAVWAYDAICDSFPQQSDIKSLDINFNKEIYPGEIVNLFHCPDSGSHIIEGRTGDRQSFICRLTF